MSCSSRHVIVLLDERIVICKHGLNSGGAVDIREDVIDIGLLVYGNDGGIRAVWGLTMLSLSSFKAVATIHLGALLFTKLWIIPEVRGDPITLTMYA